MTGEHLPCFPVAGRPRKGAVPVVLLIPHDAPIGLLEWWLGGGCRSTFPCPGLDCADSQSADKMRIAPVQAASRILDRFGVRSLLCPCCPMVASSRLPLERHRHGWLGSPQQLTAK